MNQPATPSAPSSRVQSKSEPAARGGHVPETKPTPPHRVVPGIPPTTYDQVNVTTRSTAKLMASASRSATRDMQLQEALRNVESGFVAKRAAAVDQLENFEDLKDAATDARNRVLERLDHYLVQLEQQVEANGGKVHWARDASSAQDILLSICKQHDARIITKGKSLTSEEIDANAVLERAGYRVLETDLGEYIVQLRKEKPSHIIAPALHLTRAEVEKTFRRAHRSLPKDRNLNSVHALAREARDTLRPEWLNADIGITGANFLVAETGQGVIVTNEGNGDLTQLGARAHVVIAGIDKVVATLEDTLLLLRVLARSATGQPISAYTTFFSGPKRNDELDGPSHFHLILLDNGRSSLYGSRHQPLLRCIHCGACMNHCPVYAAVGGKPYGSVYPGPIGAAFSPSLYGLRAVQALSEATTSCGRCEEVCPVRIPLVRIMRDHRTEAFEGRRPRLKHALRRAWLHLYTQLAANPSRWAIALTWTWRLGRLAHVANAIRFVPLFRPWTAYKSFPVPQAPAERHPALPSLRSGAPGSPSSPGSPRAPRAPRAPGVFDWLTARFRLLTRLFSQRNSRR